MINRINLLHNASANAFSIFINIIVQVLSVPLFIKYWGVNMYGEWILLSSFTAYFAVSDVGLTTVTINEFSINYAKKNWKKCKVLLNNNLFFIVIIFIFIFLSEAVLSYFIDIGQLFHFQEIPHHSVIIGLFVLTIQVFVVMLSSLTNAIYRATGNNARSLMIDNSVKILETVILLLCLILKFELVVLLTLFSIPKILGLIYRFHEVQKFYEVDISIVYFSIVELKKISIPAISFLSFPVGNALILQGFTLLISMMLGSPSVVLFNTMRTLTNFAKSGLSIIGNSVWPEITLSYGNSSMASLKKLHALSVGISFYLAMAISFFLLIFGKYIFSIWTGSDLRFDFFLLFAFLLSLNTSNIWSTSSVVLASTNNHRGYATLYLISCLISLIIGFLILSIFKDLSFLPLSMLLTDLVLILYVLKRSLNVVEDNFISFFKEAVRAPFLLLGQR
jgi:O-antigen/teichoic acid export membrane protein